MKKENFKLGKQIYIILLFMLVLGLVLQLTRSQALLRVGGKNAPLVDASQTSEQQALAASDIEALHEPTYVIVTDESNTYSVRIKDNVEQTLKYMKKPFRTVDYKQFNGPGSKQEHVIITVSALDHLTNNDWLETFVHDGGHVMFATVLEPDNTFYRIYRKLGIREAGFQANVKGLNINSEVFGSSKDTSFNSGLIENTAMQVRLDKGTKLLADSTEHVPILWQQPYGEGEFVMLNGTMLQEKSSRGFTAASISLMDEDFIYPILNAKLMYIDDFPAPFNSEMVADYNRPYYRFIKEIWWPDMIRAAAKFNYKFTGVVIETYKDDVQAPFEQSDDSMKDLIMYGRDVLKGGGEIGIHGYNHESLVTDSKVSSKFGYNAWPSLQDMAESVKAVSAFVKDVFPNYELHTYVPPSNVLGADGREALKLGWPGLRTISSMYSEDLDQLSYVQEFEIAKDGIAELPRVTSGFIYDEFEKWASMNAVGTFGVFSHFVHPDDVTDKERNKDKTWDQLYSDYTKYLQQTNDQFGWLRPMTATEATNELVRYTDSDPHFQRTEKGITGYINGYTKGDFYYLLRSDKEVTKLEHAEVTRLNAGMYLVKATAKQFTIGLDG
ncbi:Protein of unknown function DUF2194 [Paenibacillus curdlanolyticus YK9]|uniref:DUF2194 domain-containing protein n=1 Tax=Paenibacillus curdlanolyticus YK9 TaxID=717606 RepID=E0I9W3_9BACL|nr:DUF2194 domain-containing protein [Paenibacillus curdlanolyticus]EFM10540.1 Protein of unknown function DUF2194 [Paenibacillus curdlanolyticus YK9]